MAHASPPAHALAAAVRCGGRSSSRVLLAVCVCNVLVWLSVSSALAHWGAAGPPARLPPALSKVQVHQQQQHDTQGRATGAAAAAPHGQQVGGKQAAPRRVARTPAPAPPHSTAAHTTSTPPAAAPHPSSPAPPRRPPPPPPPSPPAPAAAPPPSPPPSPTPPAPPPKQQQQQSAVSDATKALAQKVREAAGGAEDTGTMVRALLFHPAGPTPLTARLDVIGGQRRRAPVLLPPLCKPLCSQRRRASPVQAQVLVEEWVDVPTTETEPWTEFPDPNITRRQVDWPIWWMAPFFDRCALRGALQRSCLCSAAACEGTAQRRVERGAGRARPAGRGRVGVPTAPWRGRGNDYTWNGLSCVCVCVGCASVSTPGRGRSPPTGRVRCLAAQRQASQSTCAGAETQCGSAPSRHVQQAQQHRAQSTARHACPTFVRHVTNASSGRSTCVCRARRTSFGKEAANLVLGMIRCAACVRPACRAAPPRRHRFGSSCCPPLRVLPLGAVLPSAPAALPVAVRLLRCPAGWWKRRAAGRSGGLVARGLALGDVACTAGCGELRARRAPWTRSGWARPDNPRPNPCARGSWLRAGRAPWTPRTCGWAPRRAAATTAWTTPCRGRTSTTWTPPTTGACAWPWRGGGGLWWPGCGQLPVGALDLQGRWQGIMSVPRASTHGKSRGACTWPRGLAGTPTRRMTRSNTQTAVLLRSCAHRRPSSGGTCPSRRSSCATRCSLHAPRPNQVEHVHRGNRRVPLAAALLGPPQAQVGDVLPLPARGLHPRCAAPRRPLALWRPAHRACDPRHHLLARDGCHQTQTSTQPRGARPEAFLTPCHRLLLRTRGVTITACSDHRWPGHGRDGRVSAPHSSRLRRRTANPTANPGPPRMRACAQVPPRVCAPVQPHGRGLGAL